MTLEQGGLMDQPLPTFRPPQSNATIGLKMQVPQKLFMKVAGVGFNSGTVA